MDRKGSKEGSVGGFRGKRRNDVMVLASTNMKATKQKQVVFWLMLSVISV